jgi:hypothetical protein
LSAEWWVEGGKRYELKVFMSKVTRRGRQLGAAVCGENSGGQRFDEQNASPLNL